MGGWFLLLLFVGYSSCEETVLFASVLSLGKVCRSVLASLLRGGAAERGEGLTGKVLYL